MFARAQQIAAPSYDTSVVTGEAAFQAHMGMTVEQAVAIALAIPAEVSDATAIQMAAAMLRLGDDVFDLMEDDQVAYEARRQQYYNLRDALETRYPDMTVNLSDPWTFETYSEMCKDRDGCRPSANITGAAARAWCRDPRREIEAAAWNDQTDHSPFRPIPTI